MARRLARVRIRLTQPAAHQVRAKRNLIYVDLDSAFPLGPAAPVNAPSAATASKAAASPVKFATTLDAVRAETEPKGDQRHPDGQRRTGR